MKRILVNIENKIYFERLESFCNEEKIVLKAISSPEDVDSEPFIVIVTDKKDMIAAFSAGADAISTTKKELWFM